MRKREIAELILRFADELDQYGLSKEADRITEIVVKLAKEKKNWIPKNLKEGRFTEYCKRKGYDGATTECANEAMKSDDASVRGMATFYKNVAKKKKK